LNKPVFHVKIRRHPPSSTHFTRRRETRENLARLNKRHEGNKPAVVTVARSGGLWWRTPRG